MLLNKQAGSVQLHGATAYIANPRVLLRNCTSSQPQAARALWCRCVGSGSAATSSHADNSATADSPSVAPTRPQAASTFFEASVGSPRRKMETYEEYKRRRDKRKQLEMDREAVSESERLRRARIGQANAGKQPWNKGRKHSPETIEKIRQRTAEAMLRPDVRAKAERRVRKQLTPEHKENISKGMAASREARTEGKSPKRTPSEVMLERWADPEYREKVSERLRDPDVQARRAAAIEARFGTPEERAERKRATQRAWAAKRRAERRAQREQQQEGEGEGEPKRPAVRRQRAAPADASAQQQQQPRMKKLTQKERKQLLDHRLREVGDRLSKLVATRQLVQHAEAAIAELESRTGDLHNDPRAYQEASQAVAQASAVLRNGRKMLQTLADSIPPGIKYDAYGRITAVEDADALVDEMLQGPPQPARGGRSTEGRTSSSSSSSSSGTDVPAAARQPGSSSEIAAGAPSTSPVRGSPLHSDAYNDAHNGLRKALSGNGAPIGLTPDADASHVRGRRSDSDTAGADDAASLPSVLVGRQLNGKRAEGSSLDMADGLTWLPNRSYQIGTGDRSLQDSSPLVEASDSSVTRASPVFAASSAQPPQNGTSLEHALGGSLSGSTIMNGVQINGPEISFGGDASLR